MFYIGAERSFAMSFYARTRYAVAKILPKSQQGKDRGPRSSRVRKPRASSTHGRQHRVYRVVSKV